LSNKKRFQLSSELAETVRRPQTTCRPDEFWTTIWRMW